jgi:hypothetical protein
MLNEWSDKEPDPPLSRWRKAAMHCFQIVVAVLVAWALLESVATGFRAS